VASGSLPPRRIILDYAHFNNLCMIAPIANALKPGKPLFGSLDCPLATSGGADDDRPLTGPCGLSDTPNQVIGQRAPGGVGNVRRIYHSPFY
jgi:hypothetical protein